MVQILLHAAVITVLTLLLALFSYVYRLYQEKGRQVSRRVREHLEFFHENVAPRLKLERRRAMQTFALLAQLTLVLVALAIGFAAEQLAPSPTRAIFETAFFVVLEIVLVYQFIPHVLLSRSRGAWLLWLVPFLRAGYYLVMPLLLLYDFAVSVLHLAEPEDEEPAEKAEHAIEELVEVGQERGLLAKEDVPLIASVLQFADKTAREVMTPRPEIVSISANATLEELRQLAREKRYSRVVVYGDNLDDVRGVISIYSLLDVPETEYAQRRVSEFVRPAFFIPETKPVVELIRDLQRELQQMAVVVDEYGSLAGLITLEDLSGEILGEINDADQVRRAEILKESENVHLVRGGVELEKLSEALGVALERNGATTFAGLVHNWFGYVPKPGESIERNGLRVEVLEATPRRVVRLRVTKLPPPEPVAAGRKRARSSSSQ
ncbi:MAG TPA: hemolysin family protein [Candidatus Xenobia bacterium]|nr:hemolysin family protein [Candidatus Xenobia bacterium]